MGTLFARSLSILLVMTAYAQEPASSQRAIVFNRATVVDVKNGRLSPDLTIVVVGNRIAAIGKAGAVRMPTDAQVIDATGKYLIPGLWDMHLHWAPWETPILVANGVTGIVRWAQIATPRLAKGIASRRRATGRNESTEANSGRDCSHCQVGL